jgi:hypothetical protein
MSVSFTIGSLIVILIDYKQSFEDKPTLFNFNRFESSGFSPTIKKLSTISEYSSIEIASPFQNQTDNNPDDKILHCHNLPQNFDAFLITKTKLDYLIFIVLCFSQ